MELPRTWARATALLARFLVWSGAGIAFVLTLASTAVDRLHGVVFTPGTAAGVGAVLGLSVVLPILLRWRRLDEIRRYLFVCVGATLLIFVTRPEGIIGGSIALAGGVVGVLRRL